MIVNANFRRKDESIEFEPCSIDKIIELPSDRYDKFQKNLLDDYSFLSENRNYMGFDEYGLRHCMLILCENRDDGILVDAQGSNYARYSAHLPCARDLVQVLPYQSLKDFNKLMTKTVDASVRYALENQRDGMCSIKEFALPQLDSEPMFSFPVFGQMLSERDEFDVVEPFLGEVMVQIAPEYCVENEEYEDFKVLSKEEADIKIAKHVLWLNEEPGGEQADFSDCIVRNMDLVNQNLLSANFGNGVFVDCDFSKAQLCFASSDGATFRYCDFDNVVAEECSFINSEFNRCLISNAILTNSKLSGSTFEECDIDNPKPELQNIVLE